MKLLVDAALERMSPRFEALYGEGGRESIPPEQLLRALLLQIVYTIPSERQLVEQLDYNLLFRWFVGLGVDDAVWNHSSFSKSRDRLMEGEIAAVFFVEVLIDARTSRHDGYVVSHQKRKRVEECFGWMKTIA